MTSLAMMDRLRSRTMATVTALALGTTALVHSGCHTPSPAQAVSDESVVPRSGLGNEAESEVVLLPGGVICDRIRGQVRIPGKVAVDVGYLEQVACIRGTREHEALVVVSCRPSDVHAALLLLGLESGRPGSWAYTDVEVKRIPPEGPQVRVQVRFVNGAGAVEEHPISAWLVGQPGDRVFPEQPWIFGGSMLDADGAHYRADSSGSLIGLVTFGDEVLGLGSVIADSTAIDAAEWEARSYLVPEPGTPVELVLSPWSDGS
ncbi:MAG: YdjY domain-containing protein [Planctomycetota bacterium]|nr:YdjY domain-containing protein [Planctomycetota bacterium]